MFIVLHKQTNALQLQEKQFYLFRFCNFVGNLSQVIFHFIFFANLWYLSNFAGIRDIVSIAAL